MLTLVALGWLVAASPVQCFFSLEDPIVDAPNGSADAGDSHDGSIEAGDAVAEAEDDGSMKDAEGEDGSATDAEDAPSGPIILASGASNPIGITADVTGNGDVFFTDSQRGSIMRIPSGGGPVESLALAQDSAWQVTNDTDYVYWTRYTEPDGGVARVAKSGVPSTLLTYDASQDDAMDVAVDPGVGGDVFFTTHDSSTGSVKRVAKTGGTVQTIHEGGRPAFLALDAARVYWSAAEAGEIRAADRSGGEVTTLAESQNYPYFLASDETHIYFSTLEAIHRVAKSGGGLVGIALGITAPGGLAVDAEYVYWTEPDQGTVRRAPVDGGDAETVAEGQEQPLGIAVDGAYVYWVNALAGTVLRLSKGSGS